MPIRQTNTPPSLERQIDAGDEAEIDRIVNGRVRALLAAPQLRAELMPPGRREWFEAFIRRSVEGALLLKVHKDMNWAWEILESELIGGSVVCAVIGTIKDANDMNAVDECRGWAYCERLKEEYFLTDKRDVREILKSAIETPDLAIWQRYPAWFGHFESAYDVGYVRTLAARFLPCFTPDDPLLRGLLGDDVSEARHVAAVHLAQLDPAMVDDQLLTGLLAAAADQVWTWSWRHNCRGCDEAFELLERFGNRARAAAPLLKARIAPIEAALDLNAYASWLAEAHRRIGIFESGA